MSECECHGEIIVMKVNTDKHKLGKKFQEYMIWLTWSKQNSRKKPRGIA